MADPSSPDFTNLSLSDQDVSDRDAARAQGVPSEMVSQMAMHNGMAAVRAPDGSIGYVDVSDLSKAADKGFKLVDKPSYAAWRAQEDQKSQYGGRGLEAAAQGFSDSYTGGIAPGITKGLLGGGAYTDFRQDPAFGGPAISPAVTTAFQNARPPSEEVTAEMQHALDQAQRQQVDTGYSQYRGSLAQENPGSEAAGSIAGFLAPGGAASLAGKAGKVAGGMAGGVLGGIAGKATDVLGTAASLAAEQTNIQQQIADRPMMTSSVINHFGEDFFWNAITGGLFEGASGLLGKALKTGKSGSKLAGELLGNESEGVLTPEAAAEARKGAASSLRPQAEADVATAAGNTRSAEAANTELPRYDIQQKSSLGRLYTIASDRFRSAAQDAIADLPVVKGIKEGEVPRAKTMDVPPENLTNPGSKAAAQGQVANTPIKQAFYNGFAKTPSPETADAVIDALAAHPDTSPELLQKLKDYRDQMAALLEKSKAEPTLQDQAFKAAQGNEAAAKASLDTINTYGATPPPEPSPKSFSDFVNAKDTAGPGASPVAKKTLLEKVAPTLGYLAGAGTAHLFTGGMGMGGWFINHAAGNYGRTLAKCLLEGNTTFSKLLSSGVEAIGGAAKVGAAAGLQAAKGYSYSKILGSPNIPQGAADRINDIQEAAAQPDKTASTIAQATLGLKMVSPELADGVTKWLTDTTQYLASVAPKPPVDAAIPAFDSYKWLPSEQDATEFAHRLQMVVRPLDLIQQIKDGTVTPEAIDTVEKVHPEVMQQIQQEINTHLTGLKSLPYAQRIALSQLPGSKPLDSTLTPGFAQTMAGVFASKTQTQHGGGNTAPLQKNKTSLKNDSTNYQTFTSKFQGQ